MSRLLSNKSRRISQRRPFFGFESSVSSSSLADDDPVVQMGCMRGTPPWRNGGRRCVRV